MAGVMDNGGAQHFVQVPQAMISSANNQPVVMLQPSAIPMQTVQLGNQQLVTLSPVNQSPQILENYLKAEHKALGIVQIMIGLIHIGSGMVLALGSYFISLTLVSGYVFWGGLLFIASGSVSVASEKNPIDCHAQFIIQNSCLTVEVPPPEASSPPPYDYSASNPKSMAK